MCGATSTLGSAMRSASESRRSAGRAPTRCAGTRAENSGDGAARKLAVGAISAACIGEMSVHHARQGAPRPRRPARGRTPCPCTHRHQRQPGRSHTAPAKNRHPACSSVADAEWMRSSPLVIPADLAGKLVSKINRVAVFHACSYGVGVGDDVSILRPVPPRYRLHCLGPSALRGASRSGPAPSCKRRQGGRSAVLGEGAGSWQGARKVPARWTGAASHPHRCRLQPLQECRPSCRRGLAPETASGPRAGTRVQRCPSQGP